MNTSRFLAALLSLAAGLGQWYLTGIAQRLASRGFVRSLGGGFASLIVNVAIEELLRMALIGFAAYAFARRKEGSAARIKARLYAFALLAGWAFGSMENISYLMAFPSLDVFWRLGYSLPIHMNASILYALALFHPVRGSCDRTRSAPAIALSAALALILGLAWHGVFNALASLSFFRGLPALGSVLNAAAFLTLALFAEHNLLFTGEFNGRTRA